MLHRCRMPLVLLRLAVSLGFALLQPSLSLRAGASPASAFTLLPAQAGPDLAAPTASPAGPRAWPDWPLDPSTACTGLAPSSAALSGFTGVRMPPGVTAQQLLSRLDWRTGGKVTPVKNQGVCGACYAFGAVANFEAKLLMDGAGAFDLSENSAKECNHYHTGCAGGDYPLLANLWSRTGTVLESCDPYVAASVHVCNTSCPYQHTLLGWRQISTEAVPDTNALKAYVQTYGPVGCILNVAGDPAWYSELGAYDGSYTLYRPGTFEGDHYVLIVGWDDSLMPRGGSTPGAWIVKNSWGTNWGGTCGYGNERGYFTIAYGSSAIGTYASLLSEWQAYDAQGGLLHFDENGAYDTDVATIGGTGWCLSRFTPPQNATATRIEFWASDATRDIDVYLYDEFNPSSRSVSRLLRAVENLHYDTPGYFSIPLAPPVPLRAGDDVIGVAKFTTAGKPSVLIDRGGPMQEGRTYYSATGASGSWIDSTLSQMGNLGIRLRYTTAAVQPTRTPTATPGPMRRRAFLPVVTRQ